jgi:lysophospholipase L1-like esterase
MAEVTKKTIVRALLIGINEYNKDIRLEGKYFFDRLDGCLNDVQAMVNWLDADPMLAVEFAVLQNETATKENIIAHFRSFLAQAKAGEVALIYYSGHGAMEIADNSVWTSETDGRLECLACYYDTPETDKFLLADKEIRYLMRELWDKTQAHIVGIFDCCHSGDNTRALAAAATGSKAKERKGDGVFKTRAWHNFIFADTLKPADFVNKSLEEVLPSAPHIQLSAAESNEPSIEDFLEGQIRGAFTVNLIDVLTKSQGLLSYRDLHNRVRSRMRLKFEQRPKLYAPAEATPMKDMGFLTKNYDAFLRQANLTFNPMERKYFVNRGKMHGVQAGVTIVIADLPTGDRHIGKVEKVRLDESVVVFDLEGKKAIGQTPQYVQLEHLQTRQIGIRLINKNATALGAVDSDKALIDNLLAAFEQTENSGFMALVEHKGSDTVHEASSGEGRQNADYDLILSGDTLHLTKPDDPFRPLASPINARGSKAVGIVIADLQQIAQWHYLTELKNTDAAALPEEALKVELFLENELGDFEFLDADYTEGVSIALFKNPTDGWERKAKIRVTNQTDRDLYVGGFIHSSDFSINSANMFSDEVVHFEAGESKFLFHEANKEEWQDIVRFSQEPHVYWYNWQVITERIHFIFSPEEFDASGYAITKALPSPILPQEKTKSISRKSRGGITGGDQAEETAEAVIPSWNRLSLDFHIQNPEYNAVKPENIIRMLANLEDPEDFDSLSLDEKFLAECALGLYFDKAEAFKGYSLRTDFQRAVTERGLIGDLFWGAALGIANNVARRLRYRTYKNALVAMPNQPRLVAEGDSWFQHPSIKDTIDYVGAVYPTRCISAAGDTLVDYLANPEFLSVIREVKPKGFLLSGGGNDILGDAMKTFFTVPNDRIAEGQQPERFLNGEFEKAISEALQRHKEIYQLLKNQEPQLPIFVHGYDYIIPLFADSPKRRWAGQVFDDLGIMRQGDRQAIINLMIDTFNTRLKTLAAEYNPQVHHIDLRGTVKGEQEWSDEIHPTPEGYRKVAARFISKLNEVVV